MRTNQTQEKTIEVKIRNNDIAIIISIISLLFAMFSAFRPFDKEKIVVETGKELFFYESWGNLIFEQVFYFRNNGKKQGVVTSIDGLIISNDGQEFNRHIPVKYYGNGFPFISITLNPNGVFQDWFQLLKESSPQDRTQELEFLNLYDEAKEKVWKNQSFFTPMRTYLEDEIFLEIEKFVKKRFADFKLGEYLYIVAVTKNNAKVPFDYKCYSFTILESHLQVLNNAVENYKRVDMVSNYADNRKLSEQKVRLTPITDTKTKEKLLKILLDKKNQ
jgi:hypothetical protein